MPYPCDDESSIHCMSHQLKEHARHQPRIFFFFASRQDETTQRTHPGVIFLRRCAPKAVHRALVCALGGGGSFTVVFCRIVDLNFSVLSSLEGVENLPYVFFQELGVTSLRIASFVDAVFIVDWAHLYHGKLIRSKTEA